MCLRTVIASSLCGARVLEPAASLTAPRMWESSIFSHASCEVSISVLDFCVSGTFVSGMCCLSVGRAVCQWDVLAAQFCTGLFDCSLSEPAFASCHELEEV